MRSAPLFALCAFALFAGCLEGDAPPVQADASATVAEPVPEPQAQTSGFGWEASAAVPATGYDVQLQAENAASFDVDEGRSTLTAIAAWGCAAAVTCELHAWLCDPEEVEAGVSGLLATTECAQHAMGPSPIEFLIDEPMAGEWLLVVHSDMPMAGVAGTFDFLAE